MSVDTDKSLLPPPSSGHDIRGEASFLSAGRRSLTLRSVPSVLLGVICMWAIVQLLVLRTEDSEGGGHKKIYSPVEAMSGTVEHGEQSPPRPIDGERLLAVRVLRESLSVEALAKDALRPGEVTILNFWGTFCIPCKEELPEFAGLTTDLGAPMVHFVPVLVDDEVKSSVARVMYDELQGPNPSEFVSDGRIPDAENPRLTELQAALGGRVSLPTTVVLDCEQKVRWSRTRKLEASDFRELRGVLEKVLGELDTPTCAAERRRARRPKQVRGPKDPTDGTTEDPTEATTGGFSDEGPRPRSACNADGECDAERGETVKSCPVDCRPKILIPSI